MSEGSFSPDWLRLREPFDHAARSVALVERLAAVLPDAPTLVDLGCGLGSDLRFVAPHLSSSAHWTLVDHDPLLLHHAAASVEAWSAAHPAHAPRTLTARTLDLRTGFPDGPWDAVVTQALLDLVSEDWLVALADWLSERSVPLLAALTVDGRVDWSPSHPLDAEVQAAFRAHQLLDRGFGASPGPRAAQRMATLLAERGFTISIETADWQVPANATDMLRFMVDGTAGAARVTHAEPSRVDAWHAQRTADVSATAVSLTVGHLDLLALPPGQ